MTCPHWPTITATDTHVTYRDHLGDEHVLAREPSGHLAPSMRAFAREVDGLWRRRNRPDAMVHHGGTYPDGRTWAVDRKPCAARALFWVDGIKRNLGAALKDEDLARVLRREALNLKPEKRRAKA